MTKKERYMKEKQHVLEELHNRYGMEAVIVISTYREKSDDPGKNCHSSQMAIGCPKSLGGSIPDLLRKMADEVEKENRKMGVDPDPIGTVTVEGRLREMKPSLN